MKRAELAHQLDELLQPHGFVDGQENGLQVEGCDEITRIVGAVSVNRESIQAAIDAGAQALITHHGLLWNKEPRHVRGVQRQRLRSLLAADINLFSYHLPLDAHPTLGNNAWLAQIAGAEHWEPFAEIGVQSSMDVIFSDWVEGFIARVKQDVQVATGPMQVWDFGPRHVERMAFMSGAAPYTLQQAIDVGAQVFVTGEVTEPTYHLAKEAGVHVVALGHYLSERGGVMQLLDAIDLPGAFVDVATCA